LSGHYLAGKSNNAIRLGILTRNCWRRLKVI